MLYTAATCFGPSFFAVYGLIPSYITKTMEEAQTTAVFSSANISLGLGTAFSNLASGNIPNLTGSLQQVYVNITSIALAAELSADPSLREERPAARLNFVVCR